MGDLEGNFWRRPGGVPVPSMHTAGRRLAVSVSNFKDRTSDSMGGEKGEPDRKVGIGTCKDDDCIHA